MVVGMLEMRSSMCLLMGGADKFRTEKTPHLLPVSSLSLL